MQKTFTLRRNKDGTVTFRSGKYVEILDVQYKGFVETYEAIKFAMITADIPINEDTLQELFLEARGLS